MNETIRKDVIRPTDEEGLRLAKTLIRTARHGALSVAEPDTGWPLASRVGVATDIDGAPLILVSMLAAHTRAILAEPRCSLLVGETGKGDPLAHPRLSMLCRASRIERDTPEHRQAEWRYLSHNPKAQLYAGLGDFNLFRLEPERASLNGGFGKAYELSRQDLLAEGPVVAELATAGKPSIDHMNSDHLDAIALYAKHFAKADGEGWIMTGIDPEGFEIALGDTVKRVFFPDKLKQAAELRKVLVEMVSAARTAQ